MTASGPDDEVAEHWGTKSGVESRVLTPGIAFPSLQEVLEDVGSIHKTLVAAQSDSIESDPTHELDLNPTLERLATLQKKLAATERAHRLWREDWDERATRLRLLTDLLGQWKTPVIGTILLSLGLSLFGAGDALLYLLRPDSLTVSIALWPSLAAWTGSLACLLWGLSVLRDEYREWKRVLFDIAVPTATGRQS